MSSETTSFQSLLEAVPDALVGMDAAGVIRFVNRQAELLFGYDHDELVGQRIEVLAPQTLEGLAGAPQGYFADPRTWAMGLDLLLTGRRRDGSQFPMNVRLSTIDTGDVLLVVTAASDTAAHEAFVDSQRAASIIEHSNDAIIGMTLDGIITSWNPGAINMYGYSSNQIVGRSMEILAPKDRVGEIKEILNGIADGHSVEQFETVRLRRNGTPFPLSATVSPIRDEGGAVVGASSIGRDVTERRDAYEAARAMIESSQDSLVSISPEGKINDANEATVRMTGVPRERLIGSDFAVYFTDPDKANDAYQRVFAGGSVVDFPLTMRHTDGALTDVVYNASVHRGSGDKVVGVFAAARDVTKLSEALESTRSMIESSLDSMVAISPEGRITDANEATIKVTGVPRKELIGTAFSDYFTEPQKANEIYQRVFAKGMEVDYPLTMRHRDGTLTEVLYNASVYRSSSGTVLGVFAAARNITEQRQAQSELSEQQSTDRARLAELELFQRVTVGRELQMIQLKKEIEYLRTFAPQAPNPSEEER